MKWIKYLLVLISGLVVGFVVIVLGAILFLGESHYKQILSWGAEEFLDNQLIIDGPIKLDIARNLTLTSGDIQLKDNQSNYELSVGKLHLSFRLGSYIQTGSFWFNKLELQDVDILVHETEDKFSFENLKIPPVIFEQAHITNIKLNYQELPPGTSHVFTLDELTLKEIGENQPISLQANGLFEGKPFVLEGSTGSVAQLLSPEKPVSLQMVLKSEPINFNLQGTIVEPFEGRGLNLKIHTDIPKLKDVLEIVGDDIPALGHLKGTFIVRGDYIAPQLEEIELHVRRDQEVDIKLRGSAKDIVNFAGLDLYFDGNSNNPKVLSWLLFDKQGVLQSLQASGRLQGDKQSFSLHQFNAHVETIDEMKLAAEGDITVHTKGFRLMQNHAGLLVKVQSPTTKAANLLDIDNVPELGPISGTFNLALSMDAVAVYDVNVEIGRPEQSHAHFNGDVGYIQFARDLNLSELNLQTNIQIANFAKFGTELGQEWPALGTVQLSGQLLTQTSELLLENANLKINTKGQSTFTATGLMATQLREPKLENIRLAMSIAMQANEIAQLGKQFNYELPTLGPVNLNSKIITQGSELLFQKTKLVLGEEEHSILHANGMFATQLRDPTKFRVAMDIDLKAKEFSHLGDSFDINLPTLGPTHVSGWLESAESELIFKDGLLVVGKPGKPTIRSNFRVSTHMQKGSEINTEFDLATAELIAAFTDLAPRNLGKLQGEALISDMDGSWGLESFNIATTQTNLLQWNVDGTYDDLINYDEVAITSKLEIVSPVQLAQALGVSLWGMGTYQKQGELNLTKGRLQYQGSMTMGSTQSNTELTGILNEGKPTLEGSFTIPVLNLADFGYGSEVIPITPVPHEQESDSPHVFSRDEFNVNFLNKFDLNFNISIDEVVSGDLTIDSINANISLSNGHLIVPLRLVFEGGDTDINLEIKANDVSEYELSIIADDVMLGPLLAQVQEQVPINGYSNINLNLKTNGQSPHKLASNLNGEISLGLENARIPNHYLRLLSVDVFGWVLSRAVKNTHANLNCVVMNFDVKQGDVMSTVIIADGPRLSIGGKINMSLGEETLDIVLIPKQKKRIFTSTSPVKISGPMKNPDVEAIPMRQAVQQVGSFAAMGTGLIIPIAVVSSVWSMLDDGDKVGDGCDNLEEMAKEAKEKTIKKESN